MKNTYTVAVLGFEQTEKIVLSSIFGLSARRTPKFVQAPARTPAPDIYLINASSPDALVQFKTLNAARKIPSILIGDTDHGTGWPVLGRPLQWTRLFRAFELAVSAAPDARSAPSVPPTPAPRPPAVPASAHADPFAPTLRIAGLRPAGPGQSPAAPAAPAASPPPRRTPLKPLVMDLDISARDKDAVMVVDDSPAVREFMRSKLEPFAFSVDFAASGEEAIGLTAQRQYTCIFLDVIMPGIDGYQVCKMIKARKSVRPTAIVMLTSKSSPFDKIRGAMAGCDAYLTKPVDEEKLLEVIAKFLPTTA